MDNRITLKRSYVAGKVPTAADLNPGELCYNVPDGKLFAIKGELSEDVEDIVSIVQDKHDIEGITDPTGDPLVAWVQFPVSTPTLAAQFEAGDRVKVTPETPGVGLHDYEGLYYVLAVDTGDNKIQIKPNGGEAGGDGGKLIKVGEVIETVVKYTSTVALDLETGDTIKVSDNKYAGRYQVVSHDGAGREITVEMPGLGDVASVGDVAKYDFVVVTFFTTTESLVREIIDRVIDAIEVNVKKDAEEQVVDVKLVNRMSQAIGTS